MNQQEVSIDQNKLSEAIDRGQRQQELDFDEERRVFYQKNNIIGNEPIPVDINTLELDLTEEGQIVTRDEDFKKIMQTVTLKEVTQKVIDKINESIKNSSDQKLIKQRRFYMLNSHDHVFQEYCQLGLIECKSDGSHIKDLWLYRIIEALEKRGVIKVKKIVSGYYDIQA